MNLDSFAFHTNEAFDGTQRRHGPTFLVRLCWIFSVLIQSSEILIQQF